MRELLPYIGVGVLVVVGVLYLLRDNYGKCQLCGKKLDSIYYKHEGHIFGPDPNHYEIILCEKCHKEIINGRDVSMEIVVKPKNEGDK